MVHRITVIGTMVPSKDLGCINGPPGKYTKDALSNAPNMDKVGGDFDWRFD